jgi:hypothetical protein
MNHVLAAAARSSRSAAEQRGSALGQIESETEPSGRFTAPVAKAAGFVVVDGLRQQQLLEQRDEVPARLDVVALAVSMSE